MKQHGLSSQSGYRRRPGHYGGRVGAVAPNRLNRNFAPAQPNQAWVTDITYIRTHEGWLYLAVVLDLYSRRVVGWKTSQVIDTQLVLDALLAAIWNRRPAVAFGVKIPTFFEVNFPSFKAIELLV